MPAPFGTDETGDAAGEHVDRDVLDGAHALEVPAHVAGDQQRALGGRLAVRRPGVAATGVSLDRHLALLAATRLRPGGEDTTPLGQHAAGPEPEEAEDQPADAHPLERGDEPGRPERRQVAGRLLESDRDEQRTEHGADSCCHGRRR